MKLNLYDQNLVRIASIGEQFISCLWKEAYNTAGSFSVELTATEQYKKKVKPGYFVGRTDRDTLMVINSVETDGATITATGKPASSLLRNSVFVGVIPENSVVASALKTAYNNSSKIPLLSFAESTLEDTYPEVIENKDLFALFETMCKHADIGFRGIRKDGGIQIELYKPDPNKNLKFSSAYGNLQGAEITMSIESWKNYAIVVGKDADDNAVRVDVDKTDGNDRREVFVSGGSPESEETLDAFKKRLSAIGSEELAKKTQILECSFKPLVGDFGVKYDLGDVLTVLLPEYDMRLQARLVDFTQKAQKNAVQTTVNVGEITILKR